METKDKLIKLFSITLSRATSTKQFSTDSSMDLLSLHTIASNTWGIKEEMPIDLCGFDEWRLKLIAAQVKDSSTPNSTFNIECHLVFNDIIREQISKEEFQFLKNKWIAIKNTLTISEDTNMKKAGASLLEHLINTL